MNTCQTCQSWDRGYLHITSEPPKDGFCCNPNVMPRSDMKAVKDAGGVVMMITSDQHAHVQLALFRTGKNFGCIHHKLRTEVANALEAITDGQEAT